MTFIYPVFTGKSPVVSDVNEHEPLATRRKYVLYRRCPEGQPGIRNVQGR